jgi:hypothetical protein
MEKLKEKITYFLYCAKTDQKTFKQSYLYFYSKFMYQGQHQRNGTGR